jgi:hypothetical protein
MEDLTVLEPDRLTRRDRLQAARADRLALHSSQRLPRPANRLPRPLHSGFHAQDVSQSPERSRIRAGAENQRLRHYQRLRDLAGNFDAGGLPRPMPPSTDRDADARLLEAITAAARAAFAVEPAPLGPATGEDGERWAAAGLPRRRSGRPPTRPCGPPPVALPRPIDACRPASRARRRPQSPWRGGATRHRQYRST